jgi:hypothetical protein
VLYDEFSLGSLGRGLKDNINIGFGGINSEYMNGSTIKLREAYVRAMPTIIRSTIFFFFHFVIYDYQDDTKGIILYCVLCGFKTWCVTLKQQHWLRVFENRALREILWPKREEVIGEWRRLHNEELHNPYP